MPACSKIPTFMPMGRPSGKLFNHTSSLQLSLCDRTRFRPAVASSIWGGVRNSLLKRPNQHSFAICDNAGFLIACSNIKKPHINYDMLGYDKGSFISACSNTLDLYV